MCWEGEGGNARQRVTDKKEPYGHSQNNKFARPHRQYREEGEAEDEAGKGAQVAGTEDEQTIPSTH